MKKSEHILIEFFKQFDLSVSMDVFSNLRISNVSCGDIILEKEDVINSVYIIVEGECVVEEIFCSGEVYAFEELFRGDFIGELETILDYGLSKFAVRAQTDAILMEIPRQYFYQWMEKDVYFSNYVALSLAKKLGGSADKISRTPILSGQKKVIGFLLRYCEEKLEKGKTFPIIVHKTRNEMSDKLGICVRTVNRNIRKLQEYSYISINNKKVIIDDEQYKGLREIYMEK